MDMTDPWIDIFLRELRVHGLINTAATTAGVTRRRVEREAEKNPEFEYAMESALEAAADELELEARRRAVEGVDKGVYYMGTLIETEKVYSDGLLTTLLKAKRADEFAERKQITGAGGAPITIAIRTFGEAPPAPGETINADSIGAAAKTPEIIDVEFRQLAPPSADVSLAEVLDMV